MKNPLSSKKIWVGLATAFWSIAIVYIPGLAEHIDILVEMTAVVVVALLTAIAAQDVAQEKYNNTPPSV